MLDVHLPDLHGFEVCRAIKESPATAHIPVLEVSSVFLSREDHVAGCAAVPSGTWSSLDDEELVPTCRILVSARQVEGKLRRALADAIARAQLETELRARARQHAAVADLARQAPADSDLYSLMDAAVDTVVCTLDVEYAGVLELLRAATPCSCEPGWDGRRAWWATPRSGRGRNPRPATPSPRIRP